MRLLSLNSVQRRSSLPWKMCLVFCFVNSRPMLKRVFSSSLLKGIFFPDMVQVMNLTVSSA